MTSDSEVVDKLNEIYRQLVGNIKHRHAYLWYAPPKGWKGRIHRFGYTPWKTKYNGKLGFWAVDYVYVAKLKGFKLKRAVRFGKRKVAAKRSREWYESFYRTKQPEEEVVPIVFIDEETKKL